MRIVKSYMSVFVEVKKWKGYTWVMASRERMEKVQQVIGSRIRALRKAAGLTQEQLAEKVSIAPQYLSRLETAHQVPSLDTVVDLADALSTTPSVLLADSEGDTRVEIISGVTGRFSGLSKENIEFLESQISGLLAHLRKHT